MDSIAIHNGRVFDSNQKEFIPGSVELDAGSIQTLEFGSSKKSAPEAKIHIDASRLYVSPGFIDFHGHFFEKGTDIGVDPDLASLPFGVTAVVDAGSTGISNFEAFSAQVLKRSRVTMKAFLNMAPAGLVTTQFHEDVNPELIDEQNIERGYQANRELLLGLKLRLSKEVILGHGLEPLKKARILADKLGCRLNLHMTNPAARIAEVLPYLKAGDLFAHMFHGKGETIVKDGQVLPEILKAREQGVLFDAANGANHFSFAVARDSIQCGFLPDIISTDITKNTLMKPPVFSLIHTLSKYLNMGVCLEDLIPACTAIPARIMGTDAQMGSIAPGKNADITLFDVIDQAVSFTDSARKEFVGQKYIEPVLTVKNGVILFLNPRYVNIIARG